MLPARSDRWTMITPGLLAQARRLIVDGAPLRAVAVLLDVSASDLDVALWDDLCARRLRDAA